MGLAACNSARSTWPGEEGKGDSAGIGNHIRHVVTPPVDVNLHELQRDAQGNRSQGQESKKDGHGGPEAGAELSAISGNRPVIEFR